MIEVPWFRPRLLPDGLADGTAKAPSAGSGAHRATVGASVVPAPVERFEAGNVGLGQVGEEDQEAMPVDVGERQLRAGVRVLPARRAFT